MNQDQNVDHAYQEAKLIRLLVRRHNLSADSSEIAELTREISAIENLVWSYRSLRTPERCFVEAGSYPPLCGLHRVQIIETVLALPEAFGQIAAYICPASGVMVSDTQTCSVTSRKAPIVA